MLKLYARLATRAFRLAVRGWPAGVALLLYATVFQAAGVRLAALGPVGGFILYLLVTLLLSSYLHLVSLAMSDQRIGFDDLRDSFTARFWDVASALFAVWVLELLVGKVVAPAFGENGRIIAVLAGLTMAVFFNAVPELIYLARGQVRSFGLLMASGRFVTEHWPEWLGPTVLMGAVMLAPFGLVQEGSAAERLLIMQRLFSIEGIVAVVLAMPLWLKPILLIFITWAMVFRGLLFAALVSGTARKRSWP